MTQINQGDKLTDTTFCVSICDVEDIRYLIDPDEVDENSLIKAQKLVDDPHFRSKFVDALMSQFNEMLDITMEEYKK